MGSEKDLHPMGAGKGIDKNLLEFEATQAQGMGIPGIPHRPRGSI